MKIEVGDQHYKYLKSLTRKIIDVGDEVVLLLGNINVCQVRFEHPIFRQIINEIGLDKIKEIQTEEQKKQHEKFVRVMQAANNENQVVDGD